MRFLLCVFMTGCLVTNVDGDDIDPEGQISINSLLVKTTCTATIDCAPPLTFDWCAYPQRHSIDANNFAWEFWFEHGCPNTTVGWIECEAGFSLCSKRGLVEIK